MEIEDCQSRPLSLGQCGMFEGDGPFEEDLGEEVIVVFDCIDH